MSLGLEDRSARLLSGRDVWSEIKALLSGYNDVQAAIAYVGADADAYLPLRGPATIVVNAGEEALRNGWTDPSVLLRWTRRGVRVHTLSTLHAKLLVAQGTQPFVLVGSADVLSTSGRAMEEALLLADEKDTVDEVRRAVDRWRRLAGEPLTDAWLQAAAQRYRPPGSTTAATVSSAPVPAVAAGGQRSAAPAAVDLPPAAAGVGEADTDAPDLRDAADVAGAPDVPGAPRTLDVTGPADPVPPDHSVAPTDPASIDVAVPDDTADEGDPVPDGTATPGDPAVPDGTAVPDGAAPDGAMPDSSATAAESVTAEDPTTGPSAMPTAAPAPAAPVAPPVWPRPKFIYLATLTRDGRASESAVEQLEALRQEYRVPGDGSEPVLDVEMFWWEPATRSAAKSTTYREGWHVVPISVPASGRPAVLSPVHSPGRVLQTFTEYTGGPARTYYYLLIHQQGTPTTFRKLREALTAVGEKPSYDHAYMMQHKVAAILDLWPSIHYAG